MTLVIRFLFFLSMTLVSHFLPTRTSAYVLCVAVDDFNDPTWLFSCPRPFSESVLTILESRFPTRSLRAVFMSKSCCTDIFPMITSRNCENCFPCKAFVK